MQRDSLVRAKPVPSEMRVKQCQIQQKRPAALTADLYTKHFLSIFYTEIFLRRVWNIKANAPIPIIAIVPGSGRYPIDKAAESSVSA